MIPIQVANELALNHTTLAVWLILIGSIPFVTLLAWTAKNSYDTAQTVKRINTDYTSLSEHNHLKERHEDLQNKTEKYLDKQDTKFDEILKLLTFLQK